jgi:hypothetical protein
MSVDGFLLIAPIGPVQQRPHEPGLAALPCVNPSPASSQGRHAQVSRLHVLSYKEVR